VSRIPGSRTQAAIVRDFLPLSPYRGGCRYEAALFAYALNIAAQRARFESSHVPSSSVFSARRKDSERGEGHRRVRVGGMKDEECRRKEREKEEPKIR